MKPNQLFRAVPVSKRLPEKEESYFVKYKDGLPTCIFFVFVDAKWWENNIEYWLEPLPDECLHPYASIIGEEHGNPKCLACGKLLNQ